MTPLPPLKNAGLELVARIVVLTFDRDDLRDALASTASIRAYANDRV